ncbi:MAG: hypothetical protein QXF24_00095, partial [Thermoproteota archaeon]
MELMLANLLGKGRGRNQLVKRSALFAALALILITSIILSQTAEEERRRVRPAIEVRRVSAE